MEKERNKNTLYQGCESRYLIRRLVYLVEYVTKYGGTKSEHDEIEHIKNLLEQQDIITYLQKREDKLYEQLLDGDLDYKACEEKRVRHTELQRILKDLKIKEIPKSKEGK